MTARNVLLLTLLASPPAAAQSDSASPWRDPAAPRSSAWLSLLPEGEAKRKFILDCTGCRQFDARIARVRGHAPHRGPMGRGHHPHARVRGATTSFPVIAADRDPEATAAWLARHLPAREVREAPIGSATQAEITEYMMPEPQDLPHDVAVEPGGSVLVTGMFTHRLYR
jgi:hypothetical protein